MVSSSRTEGAGSISIVVPTYKERGNIAELVERTSKVLAACSDKYEVIVVDDDSPDGTAEEVRRLQTTRPWLKLLARKHERDLSTAVMAGWRVATGEVLGCIDGDLQHPPELLLMMFDRMVRGGSDVVIGSRHIAGGGVSQWSLWRRSISWTATLMAYSILPGTLGKVHDPMSGFFLIRRSVIERAPLNPVGYKILLEVLAKGDYTRVEEVPFVFEERSQGSSKLGIRIVLHYLLHLLRISLQTGECLRLVKFGTVGLSGALVNYLALRWLMDHAGWGVLESAVVGASGAILNNFIWNECFTFPEARALQPGARAMLRRLASFAGLSATAIGLNFTLIYLSVSIFRLPPIPCFVFSIGLAGTWNFVANSNLTWQVWWNRSRFSSSANPAPLVDAATAGSRRDGLVYMPCNLCGSTQFTLFYRGTSGDRAGSAGASIFRCTSDGHGDFIDIVQCNRCGLMCENPREPEELIEQQYSQVEDPTYERETEGRVRTFSRLLDQLQAYSCTGRLLDVGCYTGVFLGLARDRGWSVAGIEPSTWAATQARNKGLEVLNAALHEIQLPAESFDVITLWDVIEHLHDPLRDMRHLCRLLRPGGVLALSTMDVGSLFAKITAERWPWHMRMHLYYFTRDTVTRLLAGTGLEVVNIDGHKRVVSFRYLIEKIAAQTPLAASLVAPLGKILGAAFRNRYVTVDFGDIMNVFAQKASPLTIGSTKSSTGILL